MSETLEFEDGQYGVRAVARASWSEQAAAEFEARQCTELELNHAKGWRGDDLAFLSRLTGLKALKIIDFKIRSVEPVHVLSELRALHVITYCRTPLRFSAFPLLEDLALEWRPKSESLFDSTSLKSLFVNNYRGKDLSLFSRLRGLESLAVLNAPIESLLGIASLIRLRTLRLANLKRLRSLDGIQALTDLQSLEVHTCPRIGSIDELATLRQLRTLHLNNDGPIASLKPLDVIRNLESVVFYESTNIVDGDLSPLVRQTHLARVSFQNRRHYSHRREDFARVPSN